MDNLKLITISLKISFFCRSKLHFKDKIRIKKSSKTYKMKKKANIVTEKAKLTLQCLKIMSKMKKVKPKSKVVTTFTRPQSTIQ